MPRPATTRKPALRKPTVRKRKTAVRKKKALPKYKVIARKKVLPKRKAMERKKTLRKTTARKKTLPKRKAKASTATVIQPRRPRLSKVAARLVTGSDDLIVTRAILKEIAANQKKADARGDKLDARIDQLAKTVSRIGKTLGDVENRWGEFIEALLVGDAHKVINGYRGIKVGPINPGFTVECDGKERELDGVCFGADMVVIIEAKSRLRDGHIGKFIGDVLQRFIEMMPAFRGAKIYGAVGYLNADRKTIEFAQKKGLIVLRTIHKTKEIVGEPSKYKLRNFHP